MAQFSVKIMRLTGSLLGENQHTKRKWLVNVDGSKQLVTVPKRVKRWWRMDALGNCFLVLRYGNRVITLSAGRTAIAVGPKSKLVSVIDTVITATNAGEMDAVLAAAQATFRKPKQTKLRKTAHRMKGVERGLNPAPPLLLC